MSSSPRVLWVDPDDASRREVSDALTRAGLHVQALADPKQAVAGARALRPDVVLVNSEVRGEVLGQVLSALAQDASLVNLPVIALCADTSESRFLHELRRGLIGLLQKPFYAPRHIGEIRALWTELSRRGGAVSGSGESPELTELVEHLRRTQRTGLLVFNARTPEEGRALFARGVLSSAEHQDRKGVEALLSMVSAVRASWTFSEVGDSSSEVWIDVAHTTGEFPLAEADELPVVAGTAMDLPDGIELEVGEVGSDEVEVPIDEPEAPAAPATGPARDPGSIPILFVDDDEGLCTMFGILFRKHGFKVDTAADGFAGYEATVSGRYELVVADLNMPRMDGWGMLRLIREDFRVREQPVVFLSCHDDYRETLKALDAGALAYFSKANKLDQLASQVKALLQPRFAARKALRASPHVPLALSKLGPQWVLRELATAKLSGLLEAKDGWALYRLTFRKGELVHAFAQAGRHVAEAHKALNAYIASRGAEGTFTRSEFPVTANLSGPIEEQLAQAATSLNENERRLQDGLLVSANEINVNDDLYALYAQVGPRPWLETARLLCEQRLPPREVIARVDASPLDVEETLRDLIRRGVVALSA